jgi:hypothetical protein
MSPQLLCWFDDSSCFIQDSWIVLGTAHRCRCSPSLYVHDTPCLPHSNTRVSSTASPSTPPFAEWHHRLGHLCWSRLSTLINKGCSGPTSIQSSFHCKGCKAWKTAATPIFH